MNEFPTTGTLVEDLETPVILIDLDALEHNIAVIADHYRDTAVKLRPHVKNHKSPQIARMQINAGGTVGGVCAAKVSEAEVFVEAGFTNVLIANQVTTADKINRLAALAKQADVIVGVDHEQQVSLLSAGALAADVVIGVVVEVNTSMRRGGVRALEDGVELAKRIVESPGLQFRGVQSHQTPAEPFPTREQRFEQGIRNMTSVTDVKAAIEAAGISMDVVSTGESWTYDVAPMVEGVTEIEGGSYIFMEVPYSYMDVFRYAARVMGTVVSRPSEHIAIGDVSVEAMGAPAGPPTVEGLDKVRVRLLTSDSTVLESDGPMPLAIGDRYSLITHQQDVTMNRWEHYVGIRNGKVETVFEVPARGCHN